MPAGLAVVTAEREDAIRKAEQLEIEMRKLRAKCQALVDELQARPSEASSQLHDAAAPTQAPDSPPTRPPASAQKDNSAFTDTHLVQLTQQLEDANLNVSAKEADIVSLHAQVISRNAELESTRAALRTELALLTQQAQQHCSERDVATQRAESSSAERDTFAQQAQQLEADLAESTHRAESLSAQRVDLEQQVEGLLAQAGQNEVASAEMQRLQEQLNQLQEKLHHTEEEVQRLEGEQGQLHHKVQSLEEEAQESFEQLTGKEEVKHQIQYHTTAVYTMRPLNSSLLFPIPPIHEDTG